MAITLTNYKRRIDASRFKLVENWCLCKWCQLNDSDYWDFSYWISELKVCVNNLKYIDIIGSVSKKDELTRILVSDYDYNDAAMIERIVREKFQEESITDAEQKAQVCAEFANGIQELIDVISNEAGNINYYISKTFKFI